MPKKKERELSSKTDQKANKKMGERKEIPLKGKHLRVPYFPVEE